MQKFSKDRNGQNEGLGSRALWRPPGFLPPRRTGGLRDVVEAGSHFRVEGDGPAVVLLHGVGLDLEMWEAQARALSERYSVIRYDMIGHGRSAKPPEVAGLAPFVRQLEMLQGYFQLQRFALVGFSMGALVAQAYALAHPDRLTGLALLSGVYERSAEARQAVQTRLQQAQRDGPAAIIDSAIARWFSPEYLANHPNVEKAIRQRLESNDRQGFLAAYRVFAEADAALAGRLGDILCPTLVATGELDGGSTPDMARRMAEALPNAYLEVLPGLRHMMPLEGAESVNTLLLDFLGRLKTSEDLPS